MFFGDAFGGGFPGGMGGMGGSMGGGGSRGPVNNTKFYDLLDVSKTASDKELKTAYRKQAMKHHPDKGGDTEKFQEISHAFEVLSDPQKREIYDQAGEEGLEGQGMGGHGDAGDIFDMFFGGGGRSRGPRGPPKTESVQTKVKVTLEQLYNGHSKGLSITRDTICRPCDGVGGPKAKLTKCASCQGQGFRVKMVRMGPMISQSRQPCEACLTEGVSMPTQHQCKSCKGRKVIKQKETLSVDIERGMKGGKRIIFENKADEKPGCVAGDIICHIEEEEHPVFARQQDDLIIVKKIDLTDVITGCEFDVKALDGRKLLVQLTPGLLKSSENCILTVPNEGMPKSGNPHIRGNLQIKFEVTFSTGPAKEDSLPALKSSLQTVPGCSGLPKAKHSINDDEVDVCRVGHFISTRASQGRGGYGDDSDDEGHGGGHGEGVQCQAQ